MDRPPSRTRTLAGLRVDEHPAPDASGRAVAELRADLGESHEPPHLHGIGRLVLATVSAVAARPDVTVRTAVTLERSAVRLEGGPDGVAAALEAVTAALRRVPTAPLASARAQLAGAAAEVTAAAFARSRRFGTVGHGLTPLALHGLAASEADVQRWADHWHGRSTHLAVVGTLGEFTQHLPADGPVPAAAPVTAARTLPGTVAWPTPAVGITWVGGPLPQDRATTLLFVDRLRERLGASARIGTEVELLEPGTQHVTVTVAVDGEEADAIAATALDVLTSLTTDGPAGHELGRAAADGGVSTTAEAVTTAAARARDELLVLLPGEARALGDLPVATVRDPARLVGDADVRLRAALWTRDRRSRLDLHPDGIRLDREDLRLVADRTSVVVLLRRGDGTRTMQLRDGRELTIDPAAWQDGPRAIEHVDACFSEVAVAAPAAGPPPADLVAAARSRRWLVAVVAAALMVPIGAALMVAATQVPGPLRALLVAAALGVTVGVVVITARSVREHRVLVAALRRREDAAGVGDDRAGARRGREDPGDG